MNTSNMNTTNTLEQFRVNAKSNFDNIPDEILTNGEETPSLYFNGVNAFASIPDNANLNFGVNTFSIYYEGEFRSGSTERFKNYKYFSTIGFYLSHLSNNKLNIRLNDGGNSWTIVSTNAITDGKHHKIGFIKGIDSASSKLIIDGIEDVTASKSGTFPTGTLTNTGLQYFGSLPSTFHATEIKNVEHFNYALTISEMQQAMYSSLPFSMIGANNTILTSGTLTIGKMYKIMSAGGTFTNLGASNNNVGTEFVATGTTPTAWGTGTLMQVGCVLNLANTSFNTLKWADISGNNNYADITNGQVVNDEYIKNTKLQYFKITGNSTVVIPKNYYIESIHIKNTTANAITGGIKIGTSSGGTQVISALAIAGNYNDVTEDSSVILKKFFSDTADTTLFLQAVTAWNSANINVTINLRKAV